MKIFKGKAFFFKSILLYIFLVLVISLVSICYWENPIYDTLIKATSSKSVGSDNISLVVIDNRSLTEHRWPWARSLYGDMFDYFNKYTKAKVVVFDCIIRALDKNNPASSDEYFFNSVKSSPNFVGAYMASNSPYENQEIGQQYDKKFTEKFKINVEDVRKKNTSRFSQYKSISILPEPYFNSLKYAGATNLNLDPFDAKLRAANDLIGYNGDFYPTIALETYLKYNNTDKVTLTDKYLIVDKTGLKIPIYISIGNVKHKIKFYRFKDNSEYSHTKYSAIDIINSVKLIREGKKPIISPSEFDNKIVIIGANALSLQDAHDTSISLNHPGVDIQATILNNFLSNDFLIRFPNILNIAIILLLSVLTFTAIRFLTFIQSLMSLVLVAVLYFIFCLICFNNNTIPLVITPLAVQLSTMIFGYSYRFILEGKNKEKIKNAMGKYLSQDIMKNVVQNIDDIKLGGKKANVTVLFADIRGFTSMSEKMTAEEVSVILNEYFSEIEPIITRYNGVINKFIGDAVMAIFGEPIQDINHPQNAVKCACAMLKKVEELQEKWLFEGKPKIEIGIGINTGEAFVGNIGSEKRLEYTVIGDMVNLASRIESYNKVYKTNMLISSSTYSYVSHLVNVIKIGDVTIRGKAKKMDIYEVLGLNKND